MDPDAVNSIQADITVPVFSAETSGGARISGYFFNNGNGDVYSNLYVKNNKVTYGISVDTYNEQEALEWDILAQKRLIRYRRVYCGPIPITVTGSKRAMPTTL